MLFSCPSCVSWSLVGIGIALGTPASSAQDARFTPPVVGQPADFSHVAGTEFRISARAEPLDVAVEEPITLQVLITGQVFGRYTPSRDKLKVFPAGFDDQFYVEPVEEKAGKDEWRFVYRVRPKNLDVQHIPELKLVYYDVRLRRYQPVFTEALEIRVRPRPEPVLVVPGINVSVAPPTFFQLQPLPMGAVTPPSATAWLVALLTPSLACLAFLWAWRRRHPRLEEVRYRNKDRAAEEAVAALAKTSNGVAVDDVLIVYLQRRLDIAVEAPTPSEVERLLKRRGVQRELRQCWRTYLETCAAGRYVPEVASIHPEHTEAARLIQALEADPCMH